jgi:conjugal transfer mating pair stabilization protein TraG
MRNSSGTASSSFEQLGESLTRLDQIAKGVSERTGLSQAQVAQIAFGANASLGISTPIVGARAQSSADKKYQSGISNDEQKVLSTMTSEQLAEFKQFGDRVSRDSSLLNVIASDSREGREMSSRLATVTSQAERAEAAYSQRRTMAERLSSARERGETISIDIAQDPHNLAMFMRYAEEYGGDSAAAHALMGAELARQGLRPNRSFSDGSALPSSFGDIRERYDQSRAEPGLDAALEVTHRRHDARVASGRAAAPADTTLPPASKIRSDIQDAGTRIQGQTGGATGRFDARAEIVEAPDGTLKSKKSLLMQTGNQVAADADASLDAAKDAVKGIINRKR